MTLHLNLPTPLVSIIYGYRCFMKKLQVVWITVSIYFIVSSQVLLTLPLMRLRLCLSLLLQLVLKIASNQLWLQLEVVLVQYCDSASVALFSGVASYVGLEPGDKEALFRLRSFPRSVGCMTLSLVTRRMQSQLQLHTTTTTAISTTTMYGLEPCDT